MAILEWDKTGQRFYEMGVKNGVLYPMKADGTYDNGVAWNGLTAVTESPDGAELTDLYADDIKYASLRSAETFGGTIEAYTYPDEFAECDGSAEISTGITICQQSRKGFGFAYVTQIGNDTMSDSDDGYKIHLVYGATASPSEKAYETINDSPDAITFSWEFATTPVAVKDHKPTSLVVIDSLKMKAMQGGDAKLQLIKDKLYGTATSEPQLPTPDEILDLIK